MKYALLFLLLTGCVRYDYCYRCTIVRAERVQYTTWCDVSPQQIQNYVERHNNKYEKCVCILIK